MGLFNRPAPQQAVPRDLIGGRQQILDVLFGPSQQSYGQFANQQRINQISRGKQQANPGAYQSYQRYLASQQGGGTAGQSMGILGELLGLTSGDTPGGDVLGPLQNVFRQNLDYGISAINAGAPGRFSTGNTYAQGQFTQNALNDFNLVAANVLEQGRNRQLQAIMGLLNPVLGPTFGGPFTQDSSIWENLLGGAGAVAGFLPVGGGRGGRIPSRPSIPNIPVPSAGAAGTLWPMGGGW